MLFRIRKQAPSEDEGGGESHASNLADDDVRAAAPQSERVSRDPIPLRQLKSQSTGQDARAERLVLGLRSEMEELRDALKGMRALTPSVYSLDIEALVDDPEMAAAIPPRMMVQELARLHDRVAELLDHLAERERDLEEVRNEYDALRIRHAVAESRNETLGDVIGALHANLEDLRLTRAQLNSGDNPRLEPPAGGRGS